jgi:hypothetical protein
MTSFKMLRCSQSSKNQAEIMRKLSVMMILVTEDGFTELRE